MLLNVEWGISSMKLSKFLLDKLLLLFLFFLISIAIFIFLMPMDVYLDTAFYLLLLIWLGLFVWLAYDYYRKAKFFKRVLFVMNRVDDPILMIEMLDDASFIEGKLLIEILEVLSKQMHDRIRSNEIAMKDYREYVEMWVHEIKTPIAASKLLLHNHPSEFSESLEEELEAVEGYVEQALYYARSFNSAKDYIVKAFDLSQSVRQVIKKHAKVFIQRHIKIELEHLQVQVYSDVKWVDFILNQIIENALKYSEDNGTIRISTAVLSNRLELIIEDNGCGISEADLPRVFDKGFTGENGRRFKKATGLGLFLCNKLCQQLYLTLRVESKLGEGTRVIVGFPMNDHFLTLM